MKINKLISFIVVIYVSTKLFNTQRHNFTLNDPMIQFGSPFIHISH